MNIDQRIEKTRQEIHRLRSLKELWPKDKAIEINLRSLYRIMIGLAGTKLALQQIEKAEGR